MRVALAEVTKGTPAMVLRENKLAKPKASLSCQRQMRRALCLSLPLPCTLALAVDLRCLKLLKVGEEPLGSTGRAAFARGPTEKCSIPRLGSGLALRRAAQARKRSRGVANGAALTRQHLSTRTLMAKEHGVPAAAKASLQCALQAIQLPVHTPLQALSWRLLLLLLLQASFCAQPAPVSGLFKSRANLKVGCRGEEP